MKRLALALILVACLALAGCGSAKPNATTQPAPAASSSAPGSGGNGTVVNTAKDEASAATCAANRAQLDQQLAMAQSSSTGAAPDLASIVAQLKVVCPSGGTYSLDSSTGKATCSVHGE
jgi:hypothetical protein